MPSDTSAASLARYQALLQGQSPAQRLAVAAALTASVRRLAELGIRRDHPDAGPEEVRARLVVRIYGLAFARRHFPVIPEDAR